MSKPTESIKKKKLVGIPEYLVKLGSYIKIGPHGGGPPNYVIQIDLAKDKEVIARIKGDPQFKERFNVSIMTPAKLEEIEKMKSGTVAITLKA
jgi:hypothetical protein